ncbi:GNAT family N-acetyltransferase [Polyangium aurulentum]|uniref:GNAT family N-acetyltransferase n=1 Tax=Polyangium aurulentum TaxID=2567896 RepID=UPI0010ADCEE8|nr:GNAT family N-acetyltransferase [Polyangium aurulentum]UQA59458.1 GNAT family N-acetyltransferase [Polyangium aurulentum]
MAIDIRLVGPERAEEFVQPILTAFGLSFSPERIARMRQLTEYDTRIAAFDGDAIVGTAGAYAVEMSTPGGGSVPTAGLTSVAVLPTHRRQGILTALMRRHFDEARAHGQAVAALWASEGPIYQRFGYGIASFAGEVSIERERTGFADPSPVPMRARLVDEATALEVFPRIWERARASVPGMLSRSPAWWSVRRLSDPEWARAGAGPLYRVLVEVDGEPQGYALYRIRQQWETNSPVGALVVSEAVGASPAGTRAVWRYLFDIDLMRKIEAAHLPIDHTLFMLLAEPRRLRFSAYDALWVRLVDVETALASRAYGARDSIVLEIEDRYCPWNEGRYRLDGGERRASRTNDAPDLRLSVDALGSAYLGGISFARLADAGRVEERAAGAVSRADALFRSARAPWCPEIF